jgi:hypothetical protein
MMSASELSLYQAALYYTERGIIVHPLYRGDEKAIRCKSPGKQPILERWERLEKPLPDEKLRHYFQNKKYNIGAVCGRASDLTVIDVDWEVKGLWEYIFKDVDKSGWHSQRRIAGKLHVLFRYTDKINRKICQDLGFDILNDKSNVVLAPSTHKDGQKYSLSKDIKERPCMPGIVAERINEKLSLYDDLKKSLGKCRHVFRLLWAAVFADKAHSFYHDTSIFRSGDGRARHLALFAELKNAGATDEQLLLACMLIFGDKYDESFSIRQIDEIKAEATAKTETILSDPVLSQFYNPLIAKNEYIKSKEPKSEKKNATKERDNEADIDIDEISISAEEKESARLEAISILQSGDPLKFILDTITTQHTGDEATEEGICVSIAGQSCLNTAGMQCAVNGESGSGKSHALKSHLHLVPSKYKRVTSLSAKAAYYMDLKPGTIIFSDDTIPSPEMEEVIKRATTNYQEYTNHTTVKDGKKASFTIPPRINWYLTSVDSAVSDQLLNRQLTFNTVDTAAQKNAIFNMQKQEAKSGELGILIMNKDVLICRRIYDIIRSRMFKVKIPYADDIDLLDKSNSRTFPLFLDMIKGYTILFHAQRETDEDGYLLATKDDFFKARKLFESQTEGIVSKLNDKERTVLAYIAKNPRCSIGSIANGTKFPYSTVRSLLKGRKDRPHDGLLEKVKGLEISDETHTNQEEEGYCISKKAEYFILNSKYDYWSNFNSGFIKLRGE